MKTFLVGLNRTIYSLVLLLAVIVLNFVLVHIAPGDAVTAMIGDMGGATPELVAKLRADYGLDQSLFTQLHTHIWKMMRGDFGLSFTHRVPVRDLILDHLPATILLVTTAFFLALITGTILGIIAAQKPKSLVSHVVTVLSLSGFAAPIFWTGLMLLIVFAYLLPLFPASGMKTPGFQGTGLEAIVDVLKHLVLPAITLASVYIAVYSRLARASMLDVLGSDYIRTARSKGLSRRVVVYKHALKNGILPVVTMAGLQFSQLIAGAVVVETVFSWPGIGQLAFNAILRRDHPLLLGILFFSTLMVVVANLITDSSYRILDPESGRDMSNREKTDAAVRPDRPLAELWHMFFANKAAVLGLVLWLLVIMTAVFGLTIHPGDPFAMVGAPMTPPGEEFLLGTDYLGRDVLTGIIHGASVTLAIGFSATVCTAIIGVTIGVLAGYYGRWVDNLLMRVTEFFQVLPPMLFVMVLISLFTPSIYLIVLAIAVVSWTGMARLARAEFLKIKEMEYVKAERAMGARNASIMAKVILPNALPPLIVAIALNVGTAILFEAALSFLGLGDPNAFSWGYMIGSSREYIWDSWWTITFPGFAIFLTVLGVSLVGDGLNDALNPKLREL